MSSYERKHPTVDETAQPRWHDCKFCGREFYDTGSFITEVYDWLQAICDDCKRKHQPELRYEVAAGTPQLAHLVDERHVVIRGGRHQDDEIAVEQLPRMWNEENSTLRVTVQQQGQVTAFTLGPEEVGDLAAILTGWLETGKLTQPTLPKKEEG